MTSHPMNPIVSQFILDLNHPLQAEIDYLRKLILSVNEEITENIKWNGPNFMHKGLDRFTMKLHPPKQIQLILHRGYDVKEQIPQRLIASDFPLLNWRSNDRAVISLKSIHEIKQNEAELVSCLNNWIIASDC